MDDKLFEELLASVEEMNIATIGKLYADGKITTLEYKKLYLHYLKLHGVGVKHE